ncbi:type VII secretion protein EccB [Gordonia soli]|nr:type VII secretion protein EccB [Gordonia soli]
MARQLTTKAQVNGYRFLLRRLEHALVRRDVRMLHDPMRSQLRALLVGSVLGLLVLGGCGIYGLVKPQGSVGNASIVVSKNGGGTYVLVDGTLHPVLNLASARLITGKAESPTSVSDGKLAAYPRGSLLGIPGAPSGLPGSAHAGTSVWSVCDTSTVSPDVAGESVELSVIGAAPTLGGGIDTPAPDQAVYVSAGDTPYLVYTVTRDDRPVAVRAPVDTQSVAVMRGLGLEGVTPRAISAGLLNTIPEVEPIRVPTIDRRGARASSPIPDATVGSVVKTVDVNDAVAYHVVLADGVQPISEVTAEILRLADRDGSAPVRNVPPGAVAAAPTVERLPVGEFPVRKPRTVDATTAPVICQTWSRGADDPRATTSLAMGRVLPLPESARPVQVTSADGDGPGVDQVYLPPGSGEYVQVTGSEPDSPRAESRFYVSDLGLRFGIPDEATAATLGVGEKPARAPWSVISLLAPGPTLSRTAALVAHDGIGADDEGRAVSAPSN